MTISRGWRILWLVRALILFAVIGCVGFALHYYGAGLPYVAETSSNPYPSEKAKSTGTYLMGRSEFFSRVGIAGTVILIATFFIRPRRK